MQTKNLDEMFAFNEKEIKLLFKKLDLIFGKDISIYTRKCLQD